MGWGWGRCEKGPRLGKSSVQIPTATKGRVFGRVGVHARRIAGNASIFEEIKVR